MTNDWLNMKCSDTLLHAGDYSDEDAWNCNTDKYDRRKIKIVCPHCKRTSAPLCSSFTKVVDGGWRWVGCDHKEPFSHHKTKCKCGEKYSFTVYTPQ